jgi:hypothetical protein
MEVIENGAVTCRPGSASRVTAGKDRGKGDLQRLQLGALCPKHPNMLFDDRPR